MIEWKDDLTSQLRVYSVAQDDAIDLVASDVAGYAGDVVKGTVIKMGSRNPDLIKPLPGRHLRAAVVRALPMAVCVGLDDIPSVNGRAFQAFRVGCLAVENVPVPGASLGPTVHVHMGDGREHRAWSNEDLDALQAHLGRYFMYEIGGFIYERSLMGKARSGVQLYTPQPFLEHVLETTALQLAERKRETAGTPSSEPPPQGSTPSPEESCAGPGDAHAATQPANPAG